MFNFGGGMLTGHEIERQIKKGNIEITPYDPKFINPNSVNLRLHPQLKVYSRGADRCNLITNKKYDELEQFSRVVRFKNFDINGLTTIKEAEDAAFVEESLKKSTDEPKEPIKSDETVTISIGYGKAEIGLLTENAVVSTLDVKIGSAIDKVNLGFDCAFDYIDAKNNFLREHISELEKYPNNESYHLEPLEMNKENATTDLIIPEEGLILWPGVLYIGRTVERTWTDKFIPMINGRSSGGRLGISIHITAGFGDIGFDGTWTLEITVVEPVRIFPNAEIAQVCFFKPSGKVKKLYRGRYQHQEDATASRFYKTREEAYGNET